MFLSCLHTVHSEQGLVLGLMSAGVIGSFTHCASMCGLFVLSQVDEKNESQQRVTKLNRLTKLMLLPYHLGRMTTYVFLAVLANIALNAFFLNFLNFPIKIYIQAPLLLLTGVIFMAHAVRPIIGTGFFICSLMICVASIPSISGI